MTFGQYPALFKDELTLWRKNYGEKKKKKKMAVHTRHDYYNMYIYRFGRGIQNAASRSFCIHKKSDRDGENEDFPIGRRTV